MNSPFSYNAIWFRFPLQVVEHGLGHLPFTEKQIITPTGNFYYKKGKDNKRKILSGH